MPESKIKDLREAVIWFCDQWIAKPDLPEWWREPLVATAPNDERFRILPRIAAPDHWQPRDLLATARSVVVFFYPFNSELALGNAEGKFASPDWGRSLAPTNELINKTSEFIQGFLAEDGSKSELTPATYNYDEKTLTARWSHKHLAHLCGLGRFGVNAQMITPAGCAGRLGSLVTEAELGDNPLVEAAELCLHKAGQECLKCLANCPVGAVTEEGIDRHRCNQRLQVNRRKLAALPGMRDDMEVCAKCVAGMPCNLQSPLPLK